jgi:hypothetical protein
MTKEQLRMQMLAGIITESEYKLRLNEDLDSMKKKLHQEIEGILFQYVDDINNARGISEDDIQLAADELADYVISELSDIANS